MSILKISPARIFTGQVLIPGDKSISHRAIILASIAQGTSKLSNLLEGHDCLATVQVMRKLGVHIALKNSIWEIAGQGVSGLIEPDSVLDCKNSGTTIRLLAGLLSGVPFMSILDGSDQLKTRPMGRIITPLKLMGAQISGRKNNLYAPLVCLPGNIKNITYKLPIASAQVKSALLLAGLFAGGSTEITNIYSTRDHTENLLKFMGVKIQNTPESVCIDPLGKNNLKPVNMIIPGDMSSASFLICAGVLIGTDNLILKNINLNPTRTGFIDALIRMGAKIKFVNSSMSAEELVGDIVVKKSNLIGLDFGGEHIVRMIDEIPILALAATQAQGKTIISDAQELKVKESNRINKTVEILRNLGAQIEETPDGMIIEGPTKLNGARLSSFGDHRLALMLAIAGLLAQDPVEIMQSDVIDDSFPGFLDCLKDLGAQ